MARNDYAVTLNYTEMVPTTKTLNVTLSDSMVGIIQDADAIRKYLDANSISTEMIVLAILTRKTPRNLTTTGGRLLRDDFNVDATEFARAVCRKHGKSIYALPEKFGGLM